MFIIIASEETHRERVEDVRRRPRAVGYLPTTMWLLSSISYFRILEEIIGFVPNHCLIYFKMYPFTKVYLQTFTQALFIHHILNSNLTINYNKNSNKVLQGHFTGFNHPIDTVTGKYSQFLLTRKTAIIKSNFHLNILNHKMYS